MTSEREEKRIFEVLWEVRKLLAESKWYDEDKEAFFWESPIITLDAIEDEVEAFFQKGVRLKAKCHCGRCSACMYELEKEEEDD